KVFFERVKQEQGGALDLLVNNVWGGDALIDQRKPFWEHSLQNGLLMQERAVFSHIITSYYGAPLLVARGQGLVIEITDGIDFSYRGTFFYHLAKVSSIHLALAMAEELRPHHVTALAITPGFLRSEAVLDALGVTEANWQEGVQKDPIF